MDSPGQNDSACRAKEQLTPWERPGNEKRAPRKSKGKWKWVAVVPLLLVVAHLSILGYEKWMRVHELRLVDSERILFPASPETPFEDFLAIFQARWGAANPDFRKIRFVIRDPERAKRVVPEMKEMELPLYSYLWYSCQGAGYDVMIRGNRGYIYPAGSPMKKRLTEKINEGTAVMLNRIDLFLSRKLGEQKEPMNLARWFRE